jgi:hypothetical protein
MEKFAQIESQASKFRHIKWKSSRRSMRSLAKKEGNDNEQDY